MRKANLIYADLENLLIINLTFMRSLTILTVTCA